MILASHLIKGAGRPRDETTQYPYDTTTAELTTAETTEPTTEAPYPTETTYPTPTPDQTTTTTSTTTTTTPATSTTTEEIHCDFTETVGHLQACTCYNFSLSAYDSEGNIYADLDSVDSSTSITEQGKNKMTG